MWRYFADIDTLHQFTQALDQHRGTLQCPKCAQSKHLVSHGFIHKKQYHGEKLKVGKRLYCSNRHGRLGCGATLRLYLAEDIPTLRYATSHLQTFLVALIAGLGIQKAYQKATHCEDPRNAYRWLRKLTRQLPTYRTLLNTIKAHGADHFVHRPQRLQLLLPTLQALFSRLAHCGEYQLIRQRNFI